MMTNIDTQKINTDLLPPNLQALVDVIGIDAALKLVEAYGGLLKCFPQKPVPGHEFEVVIGIDAFHKLCAHFGGEKYFYIPKMDNLITQMKRHLAQQLSADGHSASEIAKELGYSHRHAQRLMKNSQDDMNFGLFD